MLEITLEYNGKIFKVIDQLAEWGKTVDGQPLEGDCYIWTEGNYACDCNRSIFIQRGPNPDFPDFKCGHTIKLVDIKLIPKDGQVVAQEVPHAENE